jgi:aspartyl/glutamyl-tRNA(Asn/Gln) amidotransferase C subunit
MPKESKEKKERPEAVLEIAEITDKVLAEVIDLARLDPSAPGMSIQKEHLRKIIDHFRVLSQVHVEGLDPTIQINPTPIPLRSDEVGMSLIAADALSNARHVAGEFFLAPRILGDEQADEG